MLYEQRFLCALLLTLVVEMPVVLVFVRYVSKHKNIEIPTILFVGILASILTLPYLWFVLPAFVFNRNLFVIIGEVAVVLTETLIYYKLLKIKLSDAFFVSVVANISSIVLGLLLR